MKDPRFTQANSAFAMTCTVEVGIQANANGVWSLRQRLEARGGAAGPSQVMV